MTSTTVEPIGDKQLRIQRAFDAPIDLVFAAHTDPAHLVQWMTGPQDMALVEAQMEVRAGGSFSWRYASPSGDEITMQGVFLEVEPPHRMVQRDDWGQDLPSPEIETTFEEIDGQTVATITYTLPDQATRDHIIEDGGMVEGFSVSHDRLATLLSSS